MHTFIAEKRLIHVTKDTRYIKPCWLFHYTPYFFENFQWGGRKGWRVRVYTVFQGCLLCEHCVLYCCTCMLFVTPAPHQPRLDWQMWFAALGNYQNNPWFLNLIYRLLTGQKEVLDLMADNPFPEAPPKYMRATLYHYHFTKDQPDYDG